MKYCRILCALFGLLLILSLCACTPEPPADKGYSFMVGERTLTPGALVGTSLEGLGAYEYSESGSCGGIPGKDEVYRFSGFTVYTTPGEEGQIIAKIELTDDTYATSNGVRVGDNRSVVNEKEGISESIGGSIVYTGEFTKLTIVVRDDVVVGISYTEK